MGVHVGVHVDVNVGVGDFENLLTSVMLHDATFSVVGTAGNCLLLYRRADTPNVR